VELLEIKLDHPSLLKRELAGGQPLAEALDQLDGERSDLLTELLDHQDDWPLGWLSLPEHDAYAGQCKELAGRLAARCEELIVCGIGGSALGTQAVYHALDWPVTPLKPLWVQDNIDPSQLAWLRESADFSQAALNVISKSGGTLETMAGFFHLLEILEGEDLDDEELIARIVATTDPDGGLLRQLASDRGWPTLPVPADVGGRFSVLSPVGLFPLAFAGIDVDELLRGAAELQSLAYNLPQRENPAWQLAAVHYLLNTRGGIGETLHYIYGDPLAQLGDWFRQLWAESLAKATRLNGSPGGQCATPLVARGTTDQHSQNQLYMEGTDSRLYGFITATSWDADAGVILPEDEALKPLAYLDGRRFGELLSACCRGTRDALTKAGRPVYEITLPSLNPASIGAYLQLWMLATAYAGLMYGVNAFNQPGVEQSKQITRQYLEQD